MRANVSRLWAVVPAAGAGSRLAHETPKQYLQIGDRSLLEHSLRALLQVDAINEIVVVLAAKDDRWPRLQIAGDKRIRTAVGGERRCDSVLAGLQLLAARANAHDLVLVHDAARPCVAVTDIKRLIEQAGRHEVGGILAVPVVDTLKRVDAGGLIIGTQDRSRLYQAQTPQLFRFAVLLEALQTAVDSGAEITDESSAVEHMGLKPVVVAGSRDNIKVTYADDLVIAGHIFGMRGVT